MGIKTSIGWTDMTLNPIKGQCKGGCWYCYYSGKKGFLNRFKQDPTIRLNLDVFEKLPFHKKKIFLCSTHELERLNILAHKIMASTYFPNSY